MPKRKGQDNLRDILILINQAVHPRKVNIIKKQREVIEFLATQEGKTASRAQLEELIHFKFSNLEKGTSEWKSNSDKFYRVMSPLFKTIIHNNREQLRYTLNDIKFKTWFSSLRRTGQEMFG